MNRTLIRQGVDVYKMVLCYGLLYVGAEVIGTSEVSHVGKAALLAFFSASAMTLELLPGSDGKVATLATWSIRAIAVLLALLASLQLILNEANGLSSYLWLPVLVLFSVAIILPLSNHLWPDE